MCIMVIDLAAGSTYCIVPAIKVSEMSPLIPTYHRFYTYIVHPSVRFHKPSVRKLRIRNNGIQSYA